MRGTGDSEGYYYDEYEKQEQEDCCDVIGWISRQDWCTGNVGKLCRLFMYNQEGERGVDSGREKDLIEKEAKGKRELE